MLLPEKEVTLELGEAALCWHREGQAGLPCLLPVG